MLRYARQITLLKPIPLLLAICLIERARELESGTNELNQLLAPGKGNCQAPQCIVKGTAAKGASNNIHENPLQNTKLYYNDDDDDSV